MFIDAKKEGIWFAVTSGYRRLEIQKVFYDLWLRVEGLKVLDYIAKPGYSEHQLGAAVDLTGKSIYYTGADPGFGRTKEGKWLQKNAHKYGFIISYLKDKEKITGYASESWHYGYVGFVAVKDIYKKGLTFNKWLNTK